MIRVFSISSWITSLPCVNWGYNSSDEEKRDHGLSLTHVDASWMVGHTGKWGEGEVSTSIPSLSGAHSRTELESSWENEWSHDVFGYLWQHMETWEWWLPKTRDWFEVIIVHAIQPRFADWQSFKDGSSSFSCENFWNREGRLIVSSPFYSSDGVMWLPCTWSQFEPIAWELREHENWLVKWIDHASNTTRSHFL